MSFLSYSGLGVFLGQLHHFHEMLSFFSDFSTSAAGYCARFQADTTYEYIGHGKKSQSLYIHTLSLYKLF